MLRTRKEIASARNFAKAAPLAEHSAMPRGARGSLSLSPTLDPVAHNAW